MKKPLVNGYLVVAGGSEHLLYRGMDRDAWDTIGEAYWQKRLPLPLSNLYAGIRGWSHRGNWPPSVTSKPDALAILGWSRTVSPSSELIAVYAPFATEVCERRPWSEPDGRFLGIDVCAVGEWSLLRELESQVHPLPPEVANLINENGLLIDEQGWPLVERCYRRLSEEGVVEPIADPNPLDPVQPVWVYSVPDSAE